MSKKVAILATDGFEKSELKSPKSHLEEQGWEVDVISLKSGSIKSWDKDDWGDSVKVDKILDEVSHLDYDALVLPGGVINPDQLRTEEKVKRFVRNFYDEGKPVAAICHAPWILINAEIVSGRRMTSYHTVRKDLENAGAVWQDDEVVVDRGLITSRSPKDLQAFNRKLVEEIKEGIHAR